MRIFQNKLFYCFNKSAQFKIILFPILILFCLQNLSAQEEPNIQVRIEAGRLWDWVLGEIYLSGYLLNIEPKLKTSKNTFLGLRIGAALNSQAIEDYNTVQFYISGNFRSPNVAFSFVPTFDYYFSKKKYRPYLGLGVGYYLMSTSKMVFLRANVLEGFEININNQIGFLVRGGFNLYKVIISGYDFRKFILGFEFNYVPKADTFTPNGKMIGKFNNSYIGLSIGYLFGIGKRFK